MACRIIFFLLFFFPFVVLPFGITPFETPKIIIAEACIFCLICSLLFKSNVKKLKINYRQYLPFIAIFLLTLLQLVFIRGKTLFLGNDFRMQGIFLLWLLLGFSVISGKIKLQKVLPTFIFVLLIANLLLGFFVSGGNDIRAIGTLGEPNAFAASILFLWPFLLVTSNKKQATSSSKRKNNIYRSSVVAFDATKSRTNASYFSLRSKNKRFSASFRMIRTVVLQFAGLVIVVLVLLMSGSRSGMIAFGLQIIFLALSHYFHISLRKTAIVVGILLILSLSFPFFDRHTMYERRDDIWKAALLSGYEQPVAGWGFGNAEVALKKYNFELYNSAQGYYVDSSHNMFLDWWVQGGIIGLSALVLLLFSAIKRFISTNQTMYLVIFFGLVAAMSFNPVSIVTLIQFWWLLGQSLQKK